MKMHIGADYYPEHWPRERWATDAKLMKEAGFNVTRVAEFAWSKLEPVEGTFDFSWLEDAIKLLGEHGVQVLLCTPTPTQPKWLYDNYPETVAQDEQGHMHHFGNRQNNCFTSPKYRELSRKITTAMAEHFKGNPNVIGWQLDNELSGPFCFCMACEKEFKAFLKEQYKSINDLNAAWGTNFWSHTYASFDELHLPRNKHSSPSIYLEWRRFHSRQIISFATEQAEIIRKINPKHFITHNFMGLYDGLNYFKLGEVLDFISEDYYYNFGASNNDNRFDAYLFGAQRLDFIRGIKHKPFWIMENSAGSLGWETYGRNLRPGEIRRMTIQNMARGAVGQVWFRWRTSRYGTEQYWHGILDHSGIPGRRYNEAKDLTPLMQKIFAKIDGSKIRTEVAILTDFEDRWAFEQQPNAEGFSYTKALEPYYRALYKNGVSVDFVKPGDCLEKYKIVLAPHKYILTKEYADAFTQFVKNGGTLLTTCRTGVKDASNAVHEMPLPGFLREAAGIRVEEYEAIGNYSVNYKGKTYKVNTLADWVIPETAEVLAKYKEPGVDFAAITSHSHGKGKLWYVGSIPEDKLAERIVLDMVAETNVQTYDLPENVELVIHEKDNASFYFLLNHGDEAQEIKMCALNGTDIVTDKAVNGKITIPANDVAVVQI